MPPSAYGYQNELAFIHAAQCEVSARLAFYFYVKALVRQDLAKLADAAAGGAPPLGVLVDRAMSPFDEIFDRHARETTAVLVESSFSAH